MTASCGRIGALVMRMQGRYLETPGLTLTLRDAQRRFGVAETTCEAVLAALVDAGVLTRTPEGAYARRFPRLVVQLARASLARDIAVPADSSSSRPEAQRARGRRSK
jgi:hypothetical protein